jgi:hypothetical protein
MPLPDIFNPQETEKLASRIQSLTPQSQPLWGKMTVAQMLAHCSVPYEIDPKNPPKAGFFMKWMIKTFFRSTLVNETPYQKNIQTAPHFKMVDEKDFNREQLRLISLIRAGHGMGAGYYEGLPHYILGPLSSSDWNNLLYKHLDHHLRQFGA